MDNSTQRDEMLMRYLDGLLNAEEKTAFEKQLASDASLRAELEGLQLARAAVIDYGRKQTVASVHTAMMKELGPSTQVKQINPARRLVRRIVAVAAILVFTVLVWQGLLFYNLSAGKVFDENYIEYSPDNMRGGKTDSARQAFIDKDFKKIISLTAGSQNADDILMAAHAQLALGNTGSAIDNFKKAISLSGDNTEVKEAAEYNLILSYVRNKDFDLALELMTGVEGNLNHIYHDKMTGKLFRQVKMLKWR